MRPMQSTRRRPCTHVLLNRYIGFLPLLFSPIGRDGRASASEGKGVGMGEDEEPALSVVEWVRVLTSDV